MTCNSCDFRIDGFCHGLPPQPNPEYDRKKPQNDINQPFTRPYLDDNEPACSLYRTGAADRICVHGVKLRGAECKECQHIAEVKGKPSDARFVPHGGM